MANGDEWRVGKEGGGGAGRSNVNHNFTFITLSKPNP